MKNTPLVLIILDGFGLTEEKDSIVFHTPMPVMKELLSLPTTCELICSGNAVGLPAGYMGNSEVGHLTIGSGRVINQSFVAIEKSIEDSSFFHIPSLVHALEKTKKAGGVLHVMGLLSASGVHAHIEHFIACIQLAKIYNVPLYFHIFTDGRDSGAFEGRYFLEKLQQKIDEYSSGTLATVMGRYYAMDRDNRWERTEKAYTTLITEGEVYADAQHYLQQEYDKGITDEFIEPARFCEHSAICDNDAVFFLNFRADRARQLTNAFLGLAPFSTQENTKKLSACITMTRYAKDMNTIVLFEKEEVQHTLGEILSNAGLRQLRIAETEKYAHVTYFFNGGREEKSINEEHYLIPSPQDIPTYDKKPQMSAYEVCSALCTAIENNQYDVYICNFANTDMVGHTGNIQSAQKALSVIDECVGRITNIVRSLGGVSIITADHGNIEGIYIHTTTLHTNHTCNPVPCIFSLPDTLVKTAHVHNGELQDIAPTILYLLGIEVPEEMTGKSLLYFS